MNTKRFIDNSILPKAWRKLEPSLKLAWYYLWNNCDVSGVYEIDEDLFEFENGFELDLDGLLEKLGDLMEVNPDRTKVLLKDYIRVNQGTLKENYNPHKPVFRAINKNNLKLDPSLNQACFKLVVEVVNVVEVEEVTEGDSQGGDMVIPEKEADKQLVGEIISFFGFTELNFDKLRAAGQFVKVLDKNKQLDIFREQFPAYQQYKSISKEKIHNYHSFLGDIKEKFMNGGWNANNWVKKLQDLVDQNDDSSGSYNDRKKEFLTA